MPENHAVFAALREHAREGPAVVAHRGDSENFAENTLPAFAAALRLGVPMQEFDVRSTKDHVLACVHDESFDRTTNAATVLGPGALVAETTHAVALSLDASSWHPADRGKAAVPTLAEVLDLLGPRCIAMIEHKAGLPDHYVAEVRRHAAHTRCIVQSFDWDFVAAVRHADAAIPLALLGPRSGRPRIDGAAIEFAVTVNAGMLHWDERALCYEDVALAHDAGLLVCSYTTDDDLGFLGGAAVGCDAMCTNRPTRMMQLRRQGWLRRRSPAS